MSQPTDPTSIGSTRRLALRLLGLGGLAGAAAATGATPAYAAGPTHAPTTLDGYPTPAIYVMFVVRDAGAALEFYEQAFGAVRELVVADEYGRVVHAEFTIKGTLMAVSNEIADRPLGSPETLGGFSCCAKIKVDDIAAAVQQATDAGAIILQEPTEAYGFMLRSRVEDPFGNVWLLAQYTRDFTREELSQGARAQRKNTSYVHY